MNAEVKLSDLLKYGDDLIRSIILDWQSNPYLWPCEQDVHVDLAGQIRKRARDLRIQSFRTDTPFALNGFRGGQEWATVRCEPPVHIKGKRVHPDIAIFDVGCPSIASINEWPLFWACELKLVTSEPRDTDRNRLNNLLTARRTRYATAVELIFRHPKKGEQVVFEEYGDLKEGELKIYKAYVPMPS